MPEAGGPSASYDRAMSLLAQQGAAAAGGAGPGADYFPQNFLLRLSVKLFDCTPAQLPADLRDQLTGWLQAAPTGATWHILLICTIAVCSVPLWSLALLRPPSEIIVGHVAKRLVSTVGAAHSAPKLPPMDSKADCSAASHVAAVGVEGYMRPGCVHVTLQTMMDAAAMATDDGAHNLRDAVKHLLEREWSSSKSMNTHKASCMFRLDARSWEGSQLCGG